MCDPCVGFVVTDLVKAFGDCAEHASENSKRLQEHVLIYYILVQLTLYFSS